MMQIVLAGLLGGIAAGLTLALGIFFVARVLRSDAKRVFQEFQPTIEQAIRENIGKGRVESDPDWRIPRG